MADSIETFRRRYLKVFGHHLREGNEATLQSAYEIGRRAIEESLSVLDMAEIHHGALLDALREAATPQEVERVGEAGAHFFMECVSTFEMARRGFHEAQERARLERRYASQLRALANASLEVNSTLSLDEMLGLLTERARQIIGAKRAVTVVSGESNWANASVSVSRADPSDVQHLEEQARAVAEVHERVQDPVEPLRSSRGELREDSPWRAVIERYGIEQWLAVALVDREGRTLGLLELFDKGDGGFTEQDEAVVLQLSRIAAVAMENASLYHREHTIAETLQRSLLPERLPVVPGVELAARYVPGGAGVDIGGDWYDVIQLPGGRLGLVLGDVAGKGIRAASVMGQLRMALRAYALEDSTPALVVGRLDRFLQELDPSYMATLVYLVLDTDTSKASFVRAGHPPPLLISADGSARYLEDGESVPLGVMPHARYYQSVVPMEAASTLLLYTDGLIEERGVAIDKGLARLKTTVRAEAGDLERLCDEILEAMVPSEAPDDVALLALQIAPMLQDRLSLRLRAEPQTMPALRRTLRRWLEREGVSAEDAYEITSACSEACANAIEHAYQSPGGEFGLDARLVDGEAVIEVSDFGKWREASAGDRGRGLVLMRALMDSVEIHPSTEGTKVVLRKRSLEKDVHVS